MVMDKDTPLDAQNIVDRHLKPLLKRAGLPPVRWHDPRHTCIGRHAAEGMDEALG